MVVATWVTSHPAVRIGAVMMAIRTACDCLDRVGCACIHRAANGAEIELARMLNVKPRHMATQLREWALLGFFTRTGPATYQLNTPPDSTSSTTESDP
jgi:hypothetical protein